MKHRVERIPLERTYSVAEVMAFFGLGERKVRYLLALGRKFEGCHPMKGGLWPTFKASHKNVRILDTAIRRHLDHLERLRTDAMYAAQMKAKARELGEWRPAA